MGRFGDECTRVRFQGIDLVDREQELQQTTKLFGFIRSLQNQVSVKPAVARSVAVIGAQGSSYKPSKVAAR